MDIRQCYETLEIRPGASYEDVKQAHRDMVNIWHPDRFSKNRRLKEKAEKKLKEANLAFEMLDRHLSSGEDDKDKQRQESNRHGTGTYTKTEAFAEKSTVMVLTAWSQLSKAFHGFLSGVKTGMEEDEKDD